MSQGQLVKRIEALERQIEDIKKQLATDRQAKKSFRDYVGMFHGDKDFLEAMRLGAEYRRAQRPRYAAKRMRSR